MISSHITKSPLKGRGFLIKSVKNRMYFNSRPHEEVDNTPFLHFIIDSYFNSRPHEEVDEKEFFARNSERKFQLTTSRRGRHLFHVCLQVLSSFQLTTSRRGRRYLLSIFQLCFYISTHDLTKRSTQVMLSQSLRSAISTHDLTKRSTRGERKAHPNPSHFNSRPHEEVDQYRLMM